MLTLEIKLTWNSFRYLLGINCNNNHEKNVAANIDEYTSNTTCKDPSKDAAQLLEREKIGAIVQDENEMVSCNVSNNYFGSQVGSVQMIVRGGSDALYQINWDCRNCDSLELW